jgi:hypothetical protein
VKACNTCRQCSIRPKYPCLQLYDLHSFEVLWEKAEDTKALLAWSPERIVLSFRGTASWANVLADLQFWLKGGLSSFLRFTSACQCAFAR